MPCGICRQSGVTDQRLKEEQIGLTPYFDGIPNLHQEGEYQFSNPPNRR